MSKPKLERPIGCKFWDWADVVEWIRANTDRKTLVEGVESALWWKACTDADSVSDMNSRERAEMFLDGVRATELDDITEDIQNYHEDCANTVAEIDEMVEAELRDFFIALKG